MKLPLITKDCVDHANKILDPFYKNDFIVAEKKSYLTDLKNSIGPYMGVEDQFGKSYYILDCASQIASLGLGFNPPAFFGGAHFIESHSNNPEGQEFLKLLSSYHLFLKRKLKTNSISLQFTSSGAESIESALGVAYNKRQNKSQKKVLAFEGSFHGRMLVSLASTWNKSKREPFTFPGYETTFLALPAISDDNIKREIPNGWIKTFENACLNNFQIKDFQAKDQEQLKREIEILLEVKMQFESGEIFAVVIEPMQCEGGDRYISSRFMNGLLSLAKCYQIPLIFDEVQTGFHLGKDFFWHTSFDLKDSEGFQLHPDFVVCAKKAQSGIVISFDQDSSSAQPLDEVNVSSIIRGYYHALILDQSRARIQKLEDIARQKLQVFLNKFPNKMGSPRVCGLAFAFDLKDSTYVNKFIEKRFEHGLLFYPAGDNTLRFRLNTSFQEMDLDFLFERLEAITLELYNGKKSEIPQFFPRNEKPQNDLYQIQELIFKYKVKIFEGEKNLFDQAFSDLNAYFKKYARGEIVLIDQKNFASFKPQIEKLEELVYEPSRQTAIENFETCVTSQYGLAIALVEDKNLLGISFCSSLSDHPFESGTRRDLNFQNPKSVYMLDTTISPDASGEALGRNLKYALSVLLLTKGFHSISGRNRDQMAASMLAINASLGAYESEHIKEDYHDFEEFRDVIYYTHNLSWHEEKLNLSTRVTSPLHNFSPNFDFLKQTLPIGANKICLSNFVSSNFLNDLKTITQNLPKSLKHIYTTSGQSECVDKIIKSLWYKRQGHNNHNLITFKEHYFGKGSFLARDLSGHHDDNYFPIRYLENPTQTNFKDVLVQLEEELKTKTTFSIWIEPILQKTMHEVPEEFLKALIKMANNYHVPVVYNETASAGYRYCQKSEYCSSIPDLKPAAGMLYLGGQGGIAFLDQEYYIKGPLMVISTWDGDELSFFNYQYIQNEIAKIDYHKLIQDFEKKLCELLGQFPITNLKLKNARGSFEGKIPEWLRAFFKKEEKLYIINPSFYSMQFFIKNFEKLKKFSVEYR